MSHQISPYRIRSFVRRDSRMTAAQQRAFIAGWLRFGLSLEQGQLNYEQIFGRQAQRVLEIGFGSGESLLAAALAYPERDFIGIETHKPGVGALLLGVEAKELQNIRVYYADAVDVLEKSIPENSLDIIQIFFPDPWQKRRHHKRRLIQRELVGLLVRKLKPHGLLHLATDWEDYALHMMQVLSANPNLRNLAGIGNYADRSAGRPSITKFERRGEKAGHKIWELQFSFTTEPGA